MDKLIIENRSNLPMSEVLQYALSVVQGGRISKTSKGSQYCFATAFQKTNIIIYADRNKKSDKLIISNLK